VFPLERAGGMEGGAGGVVGGGVGEGVGKRCALIQQQEREMSCYVAVIWHIDVC